MSANVVGFIAVASIIFVFSFIFLAFSTALWGKPFDPIKALNLKAGIYQNSITGNLIEVRNFNDGNAYIVDSYGTRLLRYDILDSNYSFVGSL